MRGCPTGKPYERGWLPTSSSRSGRGSRISSPSTPCPRGSGPSAGGVSSSMPSVRNRSRCSRRSSSTPSAAYCASVSRAPSRGRAGARARRPASRRPRARSRACGAPQPPYQPRRSPQGSSRHDAPRGRCSFPIRGTAGWRSYRLRYGRRGAGGWHPSGGRSVRRSAITPLVIPIGVVVCRSDPARQRDAGGRPPVHAPRARLTTTRREEATVFDSLAFQQPPLGRPGVLASIGVARASSTGDGGDIGPRPGPDGRRASRRAEYRADRTCTSPSHSSGRASASRDGASTIARQPAFRVECCRDGDVLRIALIGELDIGVAVAADQALRSR